MATEIKASASGGIGFTGLLAIVFIILKLTGKIAWSWIWVLAPLWMPPCLVVGVVLIGFIPYAIICTAKRKRGR